MTVLELMKKRSDAWEAAKKFVDTQADKNGILKGQDAEAYAKMEKEISDLTDAIHRQERAEAFEKELAKPMATPITEKVSSNSLSNESLSDGKPKKKVSFRATDEYKDAVITAIRTNFRTISDVMQEGVDANGGYLVPDEMDRQIVKKLTEENLFRKYARTINTSGEYKINVAANKPAASWVEEGGALQFSDPTFGQIVLDAHKLSVAVKITEELLADNAFDLEGYLVEEFAKAIANAEEDAFLNGNGTHKPTGIFDATGGGQSAITIATTAIKFDDIYNLVYKLKRPYRKNAKFIMNDETVGALRKLKDQNGQYLWQPSLKEGEPDRILGYPLLTSAFCNTLQAGKPAIAFGDYSYYKIGERGVRTFQELKELYAGNGMIAYVCKERVDGKLTLPEAVQILSVEEETDSGSGSGSGAGA